MPALIDRPLSRRLADLIEGVFGPDPGLLRLRTAARAVLSAIVAVALVVAAFGASMALAPAFAAAFMIAIFGNVAVRDDGNRAKLVTLGLLVVTIAAALGLVGMISVHAWIADGAVLAICVAASLGRLAGPRGMAVGMIAFMGAFMGDFLHASPAVLPSVLAAGAIAASVVAALRLWLIRDDPARLLIHVRRHLDRRIGRIIRAVHALVAVGKGGAAEASARLESDVHRELGRLNDAFLVAQNELDDLGRTPDGRTYLSWDRFFALELAAERLLRIAAHHPGPIDRPRACLRLDALAAALGGDAPLPRPDPAADGPLLRAIDALVAALDSGRESPGTAPAAETAEAG